MSLGPLEGEKEGGEREEEGEARRSNCESEPGEEGGGQGRSRWPLLTGWMLACWVDAGLLESLPEHGFFMISDSED